MNIAIFWFGQRKSGFSIATLVYERVPTLILSHDTGWFIIIPWDKRCFFFLCSYDLLANKRIGCKWLLAFKTVSGYLAEHSDVMNHDPKNAQPICKWVWPFPIQLSWVVRKKKLLLALPVLDCMNVCIFYLNILLLSKGMGLSGIASTMYVQITWETAGLHNLHAVLMRFKGGCKKYMCFKCSFGGTTCSFTNCKEIAYEVQKKL